MYNEQNINRVKFVYYLQDKFRINFYARRINMQNLLTRMNNGEMTGMDITILILCDMFGIMAIVLHEDHLWKSKDVELNDFDVYLIMMDKSRFVSATPKSGYKILCKFPSCQNSEGNVTTEHKVDNGQNVIVSTTCTTKDCVEHDNTFLMAEMNDIPETTWKGKLLF